MLSFFPGWVSDVMLILAFIAGPTGLIWGVLQRRDANRKLVVEEGGLEVDRFDAQRQGFNDLLREQKALTDRAVAELEASRKQRERETIDIEELRRMLVQIRDLFSRVVERSNIVLTPEEQEEFDATQPPFERFFLHE